MAFNSIEQSIESVHSAGRSTTDSPPLHLESLDDVGSNLAQAIALMTMMIYLTSGAAMSDDVLLLAFPLARRLGCAARLAPGLHSTEVTRRIAQAAAMSRVLVKTVEEEALGQPSEHFQWLTDFVWTLDTEVRQAHELIAAGDSRRSTYA